jgi:hypothetical protein
VEVKFTDEPRHGESELAPAVIAGGDGSIVIATVLVALHPNESVPVTVYVVFVVGLAVTEVPVIAESAVFGAHE